MFNRNRSGLTRNRAMVDTTVAPRLLFRNINMALDKNTRDKIILGVSEHGEEQSLTRKVRHLVTGAMRRPKQAVEALIGMAEIEVRHKAYVAAWTPAADLPRLGGPFNVLDLRCWLALAEASGVPAIPAREILSMTVDDLSLMGPRLDLDKMVSKSLASRWSRTKERVAEGVAAQAASEDLAADESGPPTPDISSLSQEDYDKVVESFKAYNEALRERIFAALDDVPDNWMVRSTNTGPGSLKALAGVGAVGERAPEIRINEHISAGPGWVRVGNRRAVDVSNLRLAAAHMEGDQDGPMVFVARPWAKPARWLTGIDPHTHGTPLEADGKWPAEWRAFIYDGKVTGVGGYYAWAGAVDQQSAKAALAVRDLAQRVADAGVRCGAEPQFMSVEHARRGRLAEIVAQQAPVKSEHNTGFHATLDFIEAIGPDGKPAILLLEGGPAYNPQLPGGHPCAFAGIARPEGVAFKPMDGVYLAQPETYMHPRSADTEIQSRDFPGLSREGAIYDWAAVEVLAATGVLPEEAPPRPARRASP